MCSRVGRSQKAVSSGPCGMSTGRGPDCGEPRCLGALRPWGKLIRSTRLILGGAVLTCTQATQPNSKPHGPVLPSCQQQAIFWPPPPGSSRGTLRCGGESGSALCPDGARRPHLWGPPGPRREEQLWGESATRPALTDSRPRSAAR